MLELYVHHAGYIDSARGLEHTTMWAEPNRAFVTMKYRLRFVTIEPLLKVNIEKRSWSYTLSLSGVPSGKKHR